ncbi:glutamate--cysteine ligase [Pseudidiomarina donghaiensis]|uniref:Glutamate--cysteine ligase n=1 Tax=Pseudidiomarina donghaiensis TaxID=519452 RepID=A0A432XEF7_9GAMM|nr:glutamate--cysteine ligase [Pseudidiomarina donghaiensis]
MINCNGRQRNKTVLFRYHLWLDDIRQGKNLQSLFADALAQLSRPENTHTLRDIHRGVERETLRITKQGRLAPTGHPKQLGSAFKHPLITTDYSEALMEFITPVANDISITMQQLEDIHAHAYRHLGDELLWPLSMPCFVGDESDIVIAQYGSSHSGRMKTLYRQGLTHRYGGAMQIIAGVHYNFSLPESVWKVLAEQQGEPLTQSFISQRYFHLIRNYKRVSWVIPYLFGASPAICKSFLQHTEDNIEFSEMGKGTVYRPYGTSLRMSDLGYTNKEQADLKITYNTLDEYVAGLRRAISTPSSRFSKIGVKVDGEYRQLNSNILQIENEFYSPIRPKRVTRAGETPTQALERGGVEYIEVRALDVNPFSPVGITAEQMRMLDVLLVYCALKPSPELSWDEQVLTDKNFNRVVMDGRNPRLTLLDQGYERPISDWLEEMFADFHEVATLLDKAHQATDFSLAVTAQYRSVLNPELTLSGQFMALLRDNKWDNSELGMKLAQQYKAQLTPAPLHYFTEHEFEKLRDASLSAQHELERQDASTSFDVFLQEYFRRAECKTPTCE